MNPFPSPVLPVFPFYSPSLILFFLPSSYLLSRILFSPPISFLPLYSPSFPLLPFPSSPPLYSFLISSYPLPPLSFPPFPLCHPYSSPSFSPFLPLPSLISIPSPPPAFWKRKSNRLTCSLLVCTESHDLVYCITSD